MSLLDSHRQRATWIILLLGVGLVITLAPYATGLIGGLVLFVVFQPLHARLSRRLNPSISSALVVLLALVLIVVPLVVFAGLVVDQAQNIAGGIVQSPLLARLSVLRVAGYQVGPRLVSAGEQIVNWLGSSALGLIGTAARMALNLTISLFIAYYLLLRPGEAWSSVKPYIPFSDVNAERLRDSFRNVTTSTIIGTGLIACVQGTVVGVGFWLTGLNNAVFWGLVTTVFAVLPVVGSGLVWGPGAISLALSGRYGAAIALALVGIVVVGNVDLLIRPAIFRRYAQIHPLVTLIGAIGGVGYFGLLGILIGPLAVSYFFELLGMYKEEYLKPEA